MLTLLYDSFARNHLEQANALETTQQKNHRAYAEQHGLLRVMWHADRKFATLCRHFVVIITKPISILARCINFSEFSELVCCCFYWIWEEGAKETNQMDSMITLYDKNSQISEKQKTANEHSNLWSQLTGIYLLV